MSAGSRIGDRLIELDGTLVTEALQHGTRLSRVLATDEAIVAACRVGGLLDDLTDGALVVTDRRLLASPCEQARGPVGHLATAVTGSGEIREWCFDQIVAVTAHEAAEPSSIRRRLSARSGHRLEVDLVGREFLVFDHVSTAAHLRDLHRAIQERLDDPPTRSTDHDTEGATMATTTTPINANIVMFGGQRAGKTSLLASMYYAHEAQVEEAGLLMSRTGTALEDLDEAYEALLRLPDLVADNPGLLNVGVRAHESGDIRTFDFILTGAGVDVATLHFVDVSGEDVKKRSPQVQEQLKAADVLLVAINTPAMMEAHRDSMWRPLHMRANHPEHLADLLRDWGGEPPDLVMLCPVKCERWIEDGEGSQELLDAIDALYAKPLLQLTREPMRDTTVVVAPVATVGSVRYRGLAPYNASAPLSPNNAEFHFEAIGDATWRPTYHEQPFRWILHFVVNSVSYDAIAEGTGGTTGQKALAKVARWYRRKGYPEFESAKAYIDGQTGVAQFKAAAGELAKGRFTEPPFRVLQQGTATVTA